MIAAVSQARRINCRPILGSYVGSGLLIDKYYPFFWHFNKRCNQSGCDDAPMIAWDRAPMTATSGIEDIAGESRGRRAHPRFREMRFSSNPCDGGVVSQ